MDPSPCASPVLVTEWCHVGRTEGKNLGASPDGGSVAFLSRPTCVIVQTGSRIGSADRSMGEVSRVGRAAHSLCVQSDGVECFLGDVFRRYLRNFRPRGRSGYSEMAESLIPSPNKQQFPAEYTPISMLVTGRSVTKTCSCPQGVHSLTKRADMSAM